MTAAPPQRRVPALPPNTADAFRWANRFASGKLSPMDGNVAPEKLAQLIAEEILRRIFGDDLHGCPVRLDEISALIDQALKQRALQDQAVIDMFEKVVEAMHVLSTPPDPEKVPTPEQLRSLLGQRLDAIHTLTTKTIETSRQLKAERQGNV